MAYDEPEEDVALEAGEEVEEHPDDVDPAKLVPLSRRVTWITDWEIRTLPYRILSRRDRWYYDGVQWTPNEEEKLRERRQPALTKNRIAKKINFILGEEIDKRVMPVARPRKPSDDAEDTARAATDMLRFVVQQQEFEMVRSLVFKDMLVEGMGGAIVGVEEDDDGNLVHTLTHLEWDRLAADQHSRAPDFRDALWKAIYRWQDLEDAQDENPDVAEELEQCITNDQGAPDELTEDAPRYWIDSKRRRLKIIEMYNRIGKDWYWSRFNRAIEIKKIAKTDFWDENHRHTICPLIMSSGYVDPEGNRYGAVRAFVSPQDDLNKRSSKATHLLNVSKVMAEKGTILRPDSFQIEWGKPDAYVEVEHDALVEKRIQIVDGIQLAAAQVQLMQESKEEIDSIGPGPGQSPSGSSPVSAKAFRTWLKASSKELGPIFDHLRDWDLSVFKTDWCCVREWATEETWIRVRDDVEKTGDRFVAINRQITRAQRLQEVLKQTPPPPIGDALQIAAGEYAMRVAAGAQYTLQAKLPMIQAQYQQVAQMAQARGLPPPPTPDQQKLMLGEIMQQPLMMMPVTINQVSKMVVDIVLDEAPDTAVLADEQYEALVQMMPSALQVLAQQPEKVDQFMELVLRASSFPDKRALVKLFEPPPPDPQAPQLAQMQKGLQLRGQVASVAAIESKAQLQKAEAAKKAAEAQVEPALAAAQTQETMGRAVLHGINAGKESVHVPDLSPLTGG